MTSKSRDARPRFSLSRAFATGGAGCAGRAPLARPVSLKWARVKPGRYRATAASGRAYDLAMRGSGLWDLLVFPNEDTIYSSEDLGCGTWAEMRRVAAEVEQRAILLEDGAA